jgi:hypothetical protein
MMNCGCAWEFLPNFCGTCSHGHAATDMVRVGHASACSVHGRSALVDLGVIEKVDRDLA